MPLLFFDELISYPLLQAHSLCVKFFIFLLERKYHLSCVFPFGFTSQFGVDSLLTFSKKAPNFHLFSELDKWCHVIAILFKGSFKKTNSEDMSFRDWKKNVIEIQTMTSVVMKLKILHFK
jgi:hypothetical protein